MTSSDSSQKGPVRKLGRGLNALLGKPVQIQAASIVPAIPVSPAASRPTAPQVPVSVDEEPLEGAGLRLIPVEQIVPNRRQPRVDFDDASLTALAESIKSAGLMQPIMVRPSDVGFELIAGERRWRAAKLIGLQSIPAVVRPVDDQTAAELAIIENVQREDLNPIERAQALRRLADEFTLTHQQIADKVGLDRASVSNLLRLSDLDSSTAEHVRAGRLSQGHAKALLALSDVAVRSQFAARVMKEEWSVRELERRIQLTQKGGAIVPRGTAGAAREVTARDANVADLERQLADHLGTRVKLQLGRKKGSGRLTVEFYSLDQFDGLMTKMGFGSR